MTRASGTSQPTLPTVPVTATRTAPIRSPPSWNQTAAAVTRATREDQQADAVAAVLGLEVTGAAADAAGHSADAVGDGEPDRGDAAEDDVEEPGDRTPSAADRARGRAASRRSSGSAASSSGGTSAPSTEAFVVRLVLLVERGPDALQASADPAGKTYGSPWSPT